MCAVFMCPLRFCYIYSNISPLCVCSVCICPVVMCSVFHVHVRCIHLTSMYLLYTLKHQPSMYLHCLHVSSTPLLFTFEHQPSMYSRCIHLSFLLYILITSALYVFSLYSMSMYVPSNCPIFLGSKCAL